MRGISWFVDILRDRSKLLRLKLTNLFPNINFSGEKGFWEGSYYNYNIVLNYYFRYFSVQLVNTNSKVFSRAGLGRSVNFIS